MAPQGAAAAAQAPASSTATVFDLLETLPRISLDRLYGLPHQAQAAAVAAAAEGPSAPPLPPAASSPYPWTCRAVFQSLPPLAKQYVMRFLCLEGAVTRACLEGWVDPAAGARAREAHRRAVRRLDRLRILLTAPGKADEFELNPPFRTHLRAALASHRAGPWSDPALPPLKPDPDPRTPAQLESYMCGKWNAVLHFLVGSADTGGFDEPAEEVQRFLEDTGLMAPVPEGPEDDDDDDLDDEEDEDEEDEEDQLKKAKNGGNGRGGRRRQRQRQRQRLRITNAGVDFLLKDVHVQVWRFVEHCIAHEGDAAASRDEILTFLFQLSYCRLGAAYPVAALTASQRTLLGKFADLGLIYVTGPRFYPTAVAVNLIFGTSSASLSAAMQQHAAPQPGGARRGAGQAGAGAGAGTKAAGSGAVRLVDPNQLAVVVETNYQVVAYTTSSLHVEMLRIFCDVRCRLPNVVVGFITRTSVRRAMSSGITARTILSFLKVHAHPAVRARAAQGKGRLLPENVEAQIELWHRERTRVRFEEVMLVDLSRLDRDDFLEVCAYAESLAVVAWRTPLHDGDGGGEDDDEEDDEDDDDDGGGGPRRKKLLALRPEGLDRVRSFVEDRGYTR